MQVKATDLPGVGKKYTMETAEGQSFIIIIHHSGHRELYFMEECDDDEPCFSVDLNDEEARKIGAIMMGADYQPVVDEKMEIVRKNILIEWIKLKAEAPIANMKLGDAKIRSKTGATVIGIERNKEIIGSPEITELLLPGDILMVVGKKDQIKKFEQLCSGKRE
ncbi:TrkA domain protein [Desulfitispora alkaliphila]|uniref:cation:proton antiporter regulatory subunit n=1 Tax=Desulfitispora alkaliphila TaxID=622674 RepID=UPI003D1F0923